MSAITGLTTKNEHPEQLPSEVFLGNSTAEDSTSIGWKSKRSGNRSYCSDGSPYPYQEEHGVLPWFAAVRELESAGVPVE